MQPETEQPTASFVDKYDDHETEKKPKIKKNKTFGTNLANIISFVLLILQTASVILLMRYSRLEKHKQGLPSFATTSAVFLAELGKCLIGIFVTLYDIINASTPKNQTILTQLKHKVFNDKITVLKMSVPATLYMIQNNLQYIALQHLNAALYQIIYQLKMFSTAILASIIIKRHYTKYQWLSFLFLAIGAILANLSIVNNINNNTKLFESEKNQIFGI
eukprot:353763_1